MSSIFVVLETVFSSFRSWLNTAGVASVGFDLFSYILAFAFAGIGLRYLVAPALSGSGKSDKSKGKGGERL